jgi:MFS family permease
MGGWLIEHVSWRAIFFLNLPLALTVLLLLVFVRESHDEEETEKVDFLGAAIATVGLGAVVYGLIETSRVGFKGPLVIITLTCGIVALVAFVIIEARKGNPMLPLSLFYSQNFTGANLLTFLLYAALAGTLYFFPLNLIQVQHYTATAAGAASLPLILIMFLLSRWSGGLVKRYGSRLPLVIGPVIAMLGFALFILPGVGGTYWRTFFPAVVVMGLGMAISVAPLTTTVMNSVDERRVGIASGVNNAISRTAGLLAIAVMGIIMVHTFNKCLDQHFDQLAISSQTRKILDSERINLAAAKIPTDLPQKTQIVIKKSIDECFVFGFRRVMLVGTTLSLMSALIAGLLIRNR